MLKSLLYTLLFILLTACTNKIKPISNSEFLEKESWGLYTNKNKNEYTFNKQKSQIAHNKARHTIRFQEDYQRSYLHIEELETATENQSYLLNITLYSDNNTKTTAYEMINVKSNSSKIWLWSKKENVGLILPIGF